MTPIQAFKQILQSIFEMYEQEEAISIGAVVLEDAFGIRPAQIAVAQPLNEEQKLLLDHIIARLLKNEPVQYVLGKTVFFGLPIKVNPNVLIPRQETEELAAWVIETVGSRQLAVGSDGKLSDKKWVLDIGTGSGCIPISIKNKLPVLEVHALDISIGALETAKENAVINKTEIHFHKVNILDENAWKTLPKYDIIVSNPPYITEDEKSFLPKNVVDFEPHLALFSGGNDAQKFVKKITQFAVEHLNPGGFLFFETNEFYAPESRLILENNGFLDVELRKDLNGKDRMLRGRK